MGTSPAIPCCVITDKLLHLSELQFVLFLFPCELCFWDYFLPVFACISCVPPFFLASFSQEPLSSSKILYNSLAVHCLSPQENMRD